MIIVKHTFIEKLLKKKIQKKLEIYLNYIVDVIDEEDDSTSSGALAEILDELSRYKDILRYRYAKYLGEKYVDLLMKKIDLLEYELKLKVMQVRQLEYMYEDEMKNTRNR